MLAMAGIESRTGPPSILRTDWPRSFPFRSHRARSIAERAKWDNPPRNPYHQACLRNCLQMAMLSATSLPTMRSPIPEMICSVARQASGHMVTASPQPTVPSVVSIRQKVRCRVAPESLGSG